MDRSHVLEDLESFFQDLSSCGIIFQVAE
ncbi:MAG: hypothetical protein AAFQ80_21220 [Cyanobacteria bacterium J06621_8]